MDWSNNGRNSKKLRTYKQFKIEHSLEEYVLHPRHKALSKLRMSSHTLEIELGRHVKPQKIQIERRLYQRCMSNSIYDKIHFLISCSFFTTRRNSLLSESKLHNTKFVSLTNDEKFTKIMTVIYTSVVSNMLSKIHL